MGDDGRGGEGLGGRYSGWLLYSMVDDRLPGKKKLSISALFFPVLKSGSQKLSKDLLKWHPFPSTIFTFFVRPQFS